MSRFKNYRMTPQRQKLVDETKVAIDQIVRNEDAWGLQAVEELTGWLSNMRSHTWGDIECVIGAILPVMSMADLRDVHTVALANAANPKANETAERAA